MNLFQNPFHILNVSPRDNRRRIMELADERSLLLESSECMKARSDLTNPRKRLSAEVAWLPGIGPKRAGEVLSLLESSPTDLLALDKLSSIARANLLAAGLARLPENNADDVAEWILEISWAFEDLDSEDLSVIINEERVVSGFPEVSDLSTVEAEIQERRRYYLQVIKSVIDNLPSKDLVESVTIAVESATDNGEEQGPILIDDLVDFYEVGAQEFLSNEESNIKSLVEKIQSAVDSEVSDSEINPMVNQLIQVVKNWDIVAQPIQVSTKSRGLDHDASHRVAEIVRSLAIYMFNEHGKLDFSQQLTNMLQEVFEEVVEVSERTAEDANTLEEIAEQRVHLIEKAKHQAEEWRREITFETEIGLVFKKKLRISPEGIEWKERIWTLDSITRVRWGGTKHYTNGIYTGTQYKIIIGNQNDYAQIETKKENIYGEFIDRLWKSVGIRIMTKLLNDLSEGKRIRFESALLDDRGIELEKWGLFSGTKRRFCIWSELVIWNDQGCFCIAYKDDKKFSVSLPYQETDNVHILETVIRSFWKRAGDKLSSLLS